MHILITIAIEEIESDIIRLIDQGGLMDPTLIPFTTHYFRLFLTGGTKKWSTCQSSNPMQRYPSPHSQVIIVTRCHVPLNLIKFNRSFTHGYLM